MPSLIGQRRRTRAQGAPRGSELVTYDPRPVALPETIAKLLQTAAKLKTSGAGNEANTKALLIEPLIAALGWDPVDLDAVEREVKVFEGTFLDYALKLDGTPRVYVEAKGLNENLDDKKFIAQTLNYANNDGVVWCVLTNGSRVRVYKTNEPVAMDRKLLFEVDLTDETETAGEKAKLLRLVSRDAVVGRRPRSASASACSPTAACDRPSRIWQPNRRRLCSTH